MVDQKKSSQRFTDQEMAAMRDRVDEARKAASRGSKASKQDGEADLLAKIAEMRQPDKGMAERLHKLVKATAPELESRTYYGMPAYAKDGAVVFWYKAAQKFNTRYATLGFSDKAQLDEDGIWPTEYALPELTPATEAKIADLVRRAVS